MERWISSFSQRLDWWRQDLSFLFQQKRQQKKTKSGAANQSKKAKLSNLHSFHCRALFHSKRESWNWYRSFNAACFHSLFLINLLFSFLFMFVGGIKAGLFGLISLLQRLWWRKKQLEEIKLNPALIQEGRKSEQKMKLVLFSANGFRSGAFFHLFLPYKEIWTMPSSNLPAPSSFSSKGAKFSFISVNLIICQQTYTRRER